MRGRKESGGAARADFMIADCRRMPFVTAVVVVVVRSASAQFHQIIIFESALTMERERLSVQISRRNKRKTDRKEARTNERKKDGREGNNPVEWQ